jgi:hypothetical protein
VNLEKETQLKVLSEQLKKKTEEKVTVAFFVKNKNKTQQNPKNLDVMEK